MQLVYSFLKIFKYYFFQGNLRKNRKKTMKKGFLGFNYFQRLFIDLW